MQLENDILQIKGIGEKTRKLFAKLHIEKISDLLFLIPRDFEQYPAPHFITSDMTIEGKDAVKAAVIPGTLYQKNAGRYILSSVQVNSNGIKIELKFFNMPYLKKILLAGNSYIFYGNIERSSKNKFSMLQPKIYKDDDYNKLTGFLQPIYPLTKGLTNHIVSKAIASAFLEIDFPEDYLSSQECHEFQLESLKDAVYHTHFPKSEQDFYQAKKRLAFHEFVCFLFEMRRDKEQSVQLPFMNPMIETAQTGRLLEQLPFSLTASQQTVWQEICLDMQKNVAMMRLVQGDVGCGKTIIAFLALLMCAANNRQGCLMAPTEVLAKQHFEDITKLCRLYHLCMKPVLLLGSMSASEKKAVRSSILNQTVNVIIGTHAVITDSVQYHDLGLVITDEQHRFGVKQREKLADKGNNPHILVMSATPIPRTLAMLLYNDLSISKITDMPSGRIPIKNCVVDQSYRQTAYHFMAEEIQKGRQVYIICPMIEGSEQSEELENVIDYTEKIRCQLPSDINISYLHGKMSLAEKNSIMDAFANHNIDILISTTVIEVGINVPNATIILIENAERYGLAQLHQLRGRVGRGMEQSYCIFMSGKKNPKTLERLKILNSTNDGFEIAKKDLALRGPGELSGIRQSGDLGFQIADIYDDYDMLKLADSYINDLLKRCSNEELDRYGMILSHYQELFSVDFRTI